MLFDAIFLGMLLAGWLLCAYVPWVVLSVATRGHAGMWSLPLSLFGGVVCALAVPLLGADGWGGLWASFAVAALAPAALLGIRQAAGAATREQRHNRRPTEQPK